MVYDHQNVQMQGKMCCSSWELFLRVKTLMGGTGVKKDKGLSLQGIKDRRITLPSADIRNFDKA